MNASKSFKKSQNLIVLNRKSGGKIDNIDFHTSRQNASISFEKVKELDCFRTENPRTKTRPEYFSFFFFFKYIYIYYIY
jgi:hypothetical protein